MVKNLKPASTNYKANGASHDGRNLRATAPSSVWAPRGAPAPEYVRFPDLFARRIIQIPNFKEKPLRPPLAASSPIKRALCGPLRDATTTYPSIMSGFYEPRTTNNEPLFFREPRVNRGDVVILSLLPRMSLGMYTGFTRDARYGCPFWQPSCAFRWSAPYGPERLWASPAEAAGGPSGPKLDER